MASGSILKNIQLDHQLIKTCALNTKDLENLKEIRHILQEDMDLEFSIT